MLKWVTEFQTIDGRKWFGEYVEAPTWDLAQEWCNKNKGWLTVTGRLRSEEDEHTGVKIDYDVIDGN